MCLFKHINYECVETSTRHRDHHFVEIAVGHCDEVYDRGLGLYEVCAGNSYYVGEEWQAGQCPRCSGSSNHGGFEKITKIQPPALARMAVQPQGRRGPGREYPPFPPDPRGEDDIAHARQHLRRVSNPMRLVLGVIGNGMPNAGRPQLQLPLPTVSGMTAFAPRGGQQLTPGYDGQPGYGQALTQQPRHSELPAAPPVGRQPAQFVNYGQAGNQAATARDARTRVQRDAEARAEAAARREAQARVEAQAQAAVIAPPQSWWEHAGVAPAQSQLQARPPQTRLRQALPPGAGVFQARVNVEPMQNQRLGTADQSEPFHTFRVSTGGQPGATMAVAPEQVMNEESGRPRGTRRPAPAGSLASSVSPEPSGGRSHSLRPRASRLLAAFESEMSSSSSQPSNDRSESPRPQARRRAQAPSPEEPAPSRQEPAPSRREPAPFIAPPMPQQSVVFDPEGRSDEEMRNLGYRYSGTAGGYVPIRR